MLRADPAETLRSEQQRAHVGRARWEPDRLLAVVAVTLRELRGFYYRRLERRPSLPQRLELMIPLPMPTTRHNDSRVGRSRCRRQARLVSAIVGATLALVACGDTTGPLAREGAPAELEFSIYGFALGSSVVRLRADTVVLHRITVNAMPDVAIDTVRVVPTAEAWRAFWTAAEHAGVHRWRRTYETDGIVDGVGWGLRVVASGRSIESSGNNAYPDRRGNEHELAMTDDFRAFLAAVGELVGQPVWDY